MLLRSRNGYEGRSSGDPSRAKWTFRRGFHQTHKITTTVNRFGMKTYFGAKSLCLFELESSLESILGLILDCAQAPFSEPAGVTKNAHVAVQSGSGSPVGVIIGN